MQYRGWNSEQLELLLRAESNYVESFLQNVTLSSVCFENRTTYLEHAPFCNIVHAVDMLSTSLQELVLGGIGIEQKLV
jgi:hypothetical protein